MARHYPGARLWIAPGLERKRPDLVFEAILGDEAPAEWRGKVDQVFVAGRPYENEVAFFHRASRTLVVCDVAFHFGPSAALSTRTLMKLIRSYGRLGPTKLDPLLIRDPRAAREPRAHPRVGLRPRDRRARRRAGERRLAARARRLRMAARLTACAALLSIALVALAACEPGSVSQAPSGRCEEAGVQCELPDGPLGVCERTTCPAGATPPCFACVPQH